MADLQQIVGAILRDLAKARFSSDIYSRSIARYYENDLLLRRFSVPRADIEEVEVDLKFSIAEVTASESERSAALLTPSRTTMVTDSSRYPDLRAMTR